MSEYFNIVKILPTDYSDYGGGVERWKDVEGYYPDCASGCRYWKRLEGDAGYDWGVCTNPKSPRSGLLTWEHQAGVDCHVSG